MRVYITSNSPGELAGWVRPVAKKLKEKREDVETVLIIPPCQYASGKEVGVARSFSGIKYVLGPRDYMRYILSGRSFPFTRKAGEKEGVCVFLGGDPFHTVLVSRKLRLPAVAYLQRPRWRRQFERFMVMDERIKKENFLQQKVEPEKVVVVGDLTVDAVEVQLEDEKVFDDECRLEGPVISIMPGSRPQIACNMILFFLRACEVIKQEFARAQFFLIFSPFLKEKELFNLDRAKINKIFPVPGVEPIRKGDKLHLLTSGGLEAEVVVEGRYRILSLSDLVLTIPGTNTAELAYLGVPMLVTVPLTRPELIPLDGLAGVAGDFPFLGALIKRWVVKKYNESIRFCSIPNIRAGREIVPEVRGKIRPEDVADEAIRLLKDKKRLSSISLELKKVGGVPGAASRVADVILEVAGGN